MTLYILTHTLLNVSLETDCKGNRSKKRKRKKRKLHTTPISSESRSPHDTKHERTNSSPVVVTHSIGSSNNNGVMLSTAVVYDKNGSRKPCPVLLDCGSQANFISRQFLESLQINPRSLDISISGINNTAMKATRVAQVRLQSRISSFTRTIDCIVTERVTNKIPAYTIKRNSFDFPRNLKLADPHFHETSDVDVLIGADLFWELLCIGQVRASREHPMMQKTTFGWILAGRFGNHSPTHNVQAFHASISNSQLSDQITRFWQLEKISEHSNTFTSVESFCEQHFSENVTRTPEGRYVVKLPTRENAISRFGESRDIALKRLYSLERRFNRDSTLRKQYSQFINEYISLGHMKAIDESFDDHSQSLYLPHHCVFKSTPSSSKIRVVFDASCKTSTGVSLNDVLMVGPVVQQDLVSILLHFRTYRYVLTCDIIKMYRQIVLHSSQMQLHRILWRGRPTDDVKVYELTTLTYGTSPASYLSTRCLKHLAEQCANDCPLGSIAVSHDFYMDDMLTGADTLTQIKTVRDETIAILRSGGFELSKWASIARNC